MLASDTLHRANRAIVNEISVNMNKFVRDFDMSNDRRISHFLGQCAIESDHYKTTTEYASGAAYNGRRDLGNLQPGDGPRFKVSSFNACSELGTEFFFLVGPRSDSADWPGQLWHSGPPHWTGSDQ